MMDFPTFTGIDFEEQEIHVFGKVQWAFMSLEACTLLWFHSSDQENPDSKQEDKKKDQERAEAATLWSRSVSKGLAYPKS